jgi:nitrate reductase NapE component
MSIEILDTILATAAILAALAVAAICALGLIVWLAGGKLDQRKDQKPA